jgi:hypothetical protein
MCCRAHLRHKSKLVRPLCRHALGHHARPLGCVQADGAGQQGRHATPWHDAIPSMRVLKDCSLGRYDDLQTSRASDQLGCAPVRCALVLPTMNKNIDRVTTAQAEKGPYVTVQSQFKASCDAGASNSSYDRKLCMAELP